MKIPRTIEDFNPPLTKVELEFVRCAVSGEVCKLSKTRPEEATEHNKIRAEVIRYLALGGNEKHTCDIKGVHLTGAYVVGRLDLERSVDCRFLSLKSCCFAERVLMANASLQGLCFDGSELQCGLSAMRCKSSSSVEMRRGFCSLGEIDLTGAHIDGNLTFSGARLSNPKGHSLKAERVRVTGAV